MKVIVGLGNPGSEYDRTPHNLGYEVVDELAHRMGFSWRRSMRWKAVIGRPSSANVDLTLIKPITYMNLSGEAVAAFTSFHQVSSEDVCVVADDIHLPLGRIRIRINGSDGGHKGLRSIIQRLGTMNFQRIRIGCAPENREISDRVSYVLGKMNKSNSAWLHYSVHAAADALEMILAKGIEPAMNYYNGLKIESPDSRSSSNSHD